MNKCFKQTLYQKTTELKYEFYSHFLDVSTYMQSAKEETDDFKTKLCDRRNKFLSSAR